MGFCFWKFVSTPHFLGDEPLPSPLHPKSSLSSPATTHRFPGHQQVDGRSHGNNPQSSTSEPRRSGCSDMGKGYQFERRRSLTWGFFGNRNKYLTISVKLMVVDGLVYVWQSPRETMIDFCWVGVIYTVRSINSIKLCSRQTSPREYQDRVLGFKAINISNIPHPGHLR